jgi:MFS family permease
MTSALSAEPPFSLRSHPSFFRLWLGRGLSGIAFQMLVVAIGWQLYNLTNNPLDLGLIGLVQFVPMFCATPFAGHAADTYDRRRVSALCQQLGVIAAAALAAATLSGSVTRMLIFVVVGLLGLVRAFEFPAMSSLVPLVAPRHALQQATALYSSANQTAVVLGPALGGLLYWLHPAAPYICAAVLFLVASLATKSIQSAAPERRTGPITAETVFAGAAYIRRTPELLGSMTLDLVAVVVGAAYALLPVFARDILGTTSAGLGVLRAAPAVGALAMAVWLSWNPIRAQAGLKMFGGVMLYGVGTIALGLTSSFAIALAALIVMGAADVVSVVVRQSLVQLRTPDDMRGRVGAVNAMFIASSNQLGDFRAGLIASWFGTVTAIVSGGIAAIVVAGLWMALFPTLRTLQRVEQEQPDPVPNTKSGAA